jgi:hypothetical protein
VKSENSFAFVPSVVHVLVIYSLVMMIFFPGH